jgi:hypothetical protein
MSTREKILVGLMILALCLGGLLLISDGQPKKTSRAAVGQPKPLTQMITRVTAQFGNPSSLEENRYTLSMAQSPWRKNLFAGGPGLLSAAAATSDAAAVLPANVSLIYSGYIETPQRRVAIINGIEYVVGDQLDQSAYKVQRITPTQVVLASPQERMVSVPLVDSWEAQAPNP